MTKYKNIIYKVEDSIAYITFNRPNAMNAINYNMLKELRDIIEIIDTDDNIRAVIITGSKNAFIVGADITALKGFSAQQAREFTMTGQEIFNRFENLGKPIIAAINGYALGGGFELALACDIRIASKSAKLGLPEVKLGIFPGYGGTQRLPRIINNGNAKYLIFTGDIIDANKALDYGIVQEVVEDNKLMEYTRELALKIGRNGPIAIKMAKRAITVGMNMDLISAINYEAEAYTTCFGSEDRIEGLKAFLEKRSPNFKNK